MKILATIGAGTLGCVLLSAGSALAGAPVPAPLAGAFGPAGLLAAGAAYVGYRLYRHRRGR